MDKGRGKVPSIECVITSKYIILGGIWQHCKVQQKGDDYNINQLACKMILCSHECRV